MFSRLLASFAAVCVLAGSVWSGSSILRRERSELEWEGPSRSLLSRLGDPHATRISARVGSVRLRRGESAFFEVCASDALEPKRWENALQFMVWRPKTRELMVRVPLDQAHLMAVKRRGDRACLPLGGGVIPADGAYAIEAVWASKRPPLALMRVAWTPRVLARRLLTWRDQVPVWLVALGVLLGVFALYRVGVHTTSDRPGRANPAYGALLMAVVTLGIAWLASRFAPFHGPTAGFIKGVALMLVEGGAAFVCAAWIVRRTSGGGVRSMLALALPRQRWLRSALWMLPLSITTGFVLSQVARVALNLIPATADAPIQSFVAWPSGTLSFAALGALLPVGEELFFRGLVYGALEQRSKVVAFLLSSSLFVVFHAHQVWGNWGAFVAITITGVMLTLLRARTGSTLVPVVVHIAYNLSLSNGAFGWS